MLSKLALGTVQFGLDYGINNNTGKLPETEIKKILDLAYSSEIIYLDTAYLYGESEEKIGKYIIDNRQSFNIISKAPDCNKQEVQGYFEKSLKKLNVDSLYGYLFHDFNTYINDKSIFDKLLELKKKTKIKKIGFSLYFPKDLEIILNDHIPIDLLQIPYNLLDRRFEPYFEELKNTGVEIHIRSVFLQGLFFKKYKSLNNKLLPFSDFLIRLNRFANENGTRIEKIAFDFGLQNRFVDKIIVGVDNHSQLLNLIEIEQNKTNPLDISDINVMISEQKIPEELLIPSNWD